MLKIKVHLAKSTTFLSKPAALGIQAYQGMLFGGRPAEQRYNHFALEVDGKIYQSTFVGVGTESLESFKTHYKIQKTYEYEVAIDKIDFVHWFKKYDGRKYDFLQIANIWFRRSFGVNLGIGHDDRNLICNEVYLLCMNRFVEHIVDVKKIDKYDLVMSEDVLETHRKTGKCLLIKDWDKKEIKPEKEDEDFLDDFIGD